MNCLDFRRGKLADPRRLSAEARAHVSECPACAAFAREVDESERALGEALQTQVPDGLADRIIFQSRKPRVAWRAWALAASVVLAVATGLAFVQAPDKDADRYARLSIEHVVMEPESFTTLRNADPEAFRAAVQNFGATLKDIPGRIRYIRLCPVEDGMGWHIVFETPEGLATLILVPGKQMPQTQSASMKGWNALARPVKGGYYAIVTASPAATSSFEKMLRDCVLWDA